MCRKVNGRLILPDSPTLAPSAVAEIYKENIINNYISANPAVALPELPVAADELQAELHRVLSSSGFSHAPRARSLLAYMVERYQSGAVRDLQEYAIGLSVFWRDVATYSTVDDPVVRVQVGRLRRKLDEYYATEGRSSGIHISIPARGYVPEVVLQQTPRVVPRIAVDRLSYLGEEAEVASFNRGLNEELTYQLHQMPDMAFVLGQETAGAALPEGWRATHKLSGSLRADSGTLRVTLRLLDVQRNSVAWSSQTDVDRALSIEQQTRLSQACCEALRKYLQQGG